MRNGRGKWTRRATRQNERNIGDGDIEASGQSEKGNRQELKQRERERKNKTNERN